MDLINSLARSTKGHDAGTIYTIINVEGHRACLADGKLKTISKPKLKSIKHIELLDDTKLMQSSNDYKTEKAKVSVPSSMKDEDIRRVIKLYKKSQEI